MMGLGWASRGCVCRRFGSDRVQVLGGVDVQVSDWRSCSTRVPIADRFAFPKIRSLPNGPGTPGPRLRPGVH
ncbi:hypothetical protein JCM33774_45030 [Actinophytocola sp. KF-1]